MGPEESSCTKQIDVVFMGYIAGHSGKDLDQTKILKMHLYYTLKELGNQFSYHPSAYPFIT